MTAQTVFTIIVVALIFIWLAQLVLLYVAAQNQRQDPYRLVSGSAIFFPIPLPIAQIAPALVDTVGGFIEGVVNGIFRGGQNAPPGTAANPMEPGGMPAPGAPSGETVARLLVDGREIPLTLARTRLGRYPNNEVVIENSTVSAYHAEIIRRPDHRHEIVDRESRNGTRVNGALVRTQILKDGDLITLGGATLHYLNSPVTSEPQQQHPSGTEPYATEQGGYPPQGQPPPGSPTPSE